MHVQTKVAVAPPPAMDCGGAGLAGLQVAPAAGLAVGVTPVTVAPEVPLLRSTSVKVAAWLVLTVPGKAVRGGARTAAVCTVTGAPVTVGLMLAPLTASVATTVAP